MERRVAAAHVLITDVVQPVPRRGATRSARRSSVAHHEARRRGADQRPASAAVHGRVELGLFGRGEEAHAAEVHREQRAAYVPPAPARRAARCHRRRARPAAGTSARAWRADGRPRSCRVRDRRRRGPRCCRRASRASRRRPRRVARSVSGDRPRIATRPTARLMRTGAVGTSWGCWARTQSSTRRAMPAASRPTMASNSSRLPWPTTGSPAARMRS